MEKYADILFKDDICHLKNIMGNRFAKTVRLTSISVTHHFRMEILGGPISRHLHYETKIALHGMYLAHVAFKVIPRNPAG